MIDIKAKLKRSYPNYSDRIDRMASMAEEIAYSKDQIESMNEIVQKLDVMDAYVLGMITGEMIKDGALHISGLNSCTKKQK